MKKVLLQTIGEKHVYELFPIGSLEISRFKSDLNIPY